MLGADVAAGALAPLLGPRALRAYPAILSTEAEATAWARAGAPAGAVVVAAYQASPRGRGGLPWTCAPERSLGFSLVLRPAPDEGRDGWLYLVAAAALAERLDAPEFAWPDEVGTGDGGLGARVAVGAAGEPGPGGWAVLSCLIEGACPPRGLLLAGVVAAVESWGTRPTADVVDAARAHCTTLGRRVRARMVPLGPRGTVVTGTAVDLDAAGALVIEGDDGRRRVVPPAGVGALDLADTNAW